MTKQNDAEVVLGDGAKGDLAQPHLTQRDLDEKEAEKQAARAAREERKQAAHE